MRGGNSGTVGHVFQPFAFRTIEQAVGSLKRAIHAGFRFDQFQHLAFGCMGECPHFSIVLCRVAQVMKLVRRLLHIHAVHSAVVCGNPHQSVAVDVRRVNHIGHSLDGENQLVFIVVVIAPSSACGVDPCAAHVIFQQEEMLPQLSGIACVQRRCEALPLAEAVTQDAWFVVRLPDDAA